MTATFAVDSSALVAILNSEAEASAFQEALASSGCVIGWATIFETRLWCLRRERTELGEWLDAFAASGRVEAVAFDGVLETLAADAYARFGKGRHPAQLNYGDCMAYAVARHHDLPLLFKGSDFGKTDVRAHAASVAHG